jgi:predicted transcriptional regulator
MQNLIEIHCKEIKEDNCIYIPASDSKCSFIDTSDIGEIIAKIFTEEEKHHNKAYTITGIESLDYFEISKILTTVLERKIVYSNPSIIFFMNYMLFKRKLNYMYVFVMCMLYMMTRYDNFL